MKANQSFGSTFTSMFRSAINQRSYLIRTGDNKKNETIVRTIMDKLLPYKHTKFTDEGAAKFIMNHEYEISYIIPAHLHNVRTQFYNMVTIAKQYNPSVASF